MNASPRTTRLSMSRPFAYLAEESPDRYADDDDQAPSSISHAQEKADDASGIVLIFLRELPDDLVSETRPRYEFIRASADDDEPQTISWTNDESLHGYLQKFSYAGICPKPLSHEIEVMLISVEIGGVPDVLEMYTFVTVDKLHRMLVFSEPSADVIAAAATVENSETASSQQDSLTSLLFRTDDSIGDEEGIELDDDDDDGEDADDEYESSEQEMTEGTQSGRKPPFRFPDLPNRGIHEFNLFLPPVYAIGQLLGQGEFSKVYIAININTQSLYAVKVFRSRQSHVVNEQIMREVETLKGLQCPNIVKMEETIVYGDNIFIVTELLQKGDLRIYINRNGCLPEMESRRLFIDLLNGISYIHRRRIVHLDLKLENLLLDDAYNLKIADFGCARVQMGQKLFRYPCGSYAYGAPEVISGNEYDGKKADVWSMGVVLYCMVMARLPFSDKQQEVPDMLSERNKVPAIQKPVTESCKNLVTRLLTYEKEKRPNIQEVMSHQWLLVSPGEQNCLLSTD